MVDASPWRSARVPTPALAWTHFALAAHESSKQPRSTVQAQGVVVDTVLHDNFTSAVEEMVASEAADLLVLGNPQPPRSRAPDDGRRCGTHPAQVTGARTAGTRSGDRIEGRNGPGAGAHEPRASAGVRMMTPAVDRVFPSDALH